MRQNNSHLIDGATLGRAFSFCDVTDDDLAFAVAAMSDSWRAEIATRLGRLATDLQALAVIATEAERRFLDAAAACSGT